MSDIPRTPREPRSEEDPRDPRDERRDDDPRDPRDHPRSLDEADLDLSAAIRSWHQLRWVALGVLATILSIAVVGGSVIIFHQSNQIAQAREQLTAGCRFFSDLAGLPLTPVPPQPRPSRFGVTVVVDSRIAAIGLGCPTLPRPTPSLVKWAAFYHIEIP